MEQIASALDRIQVDLGLQIIFVPMHSNDESAIREVIHLMQTSGHSPDHGYDPGLAVGLIHNSTLCLTMKHHPIIFAMAAGVPTISMAFDPYYYHKNSGAQEIFGQEKFVIYSAPEKLSQSIEESVTESYNRRDSLSSEIKARVEELRPMAGEVIHRYFRETGRNVLTAQ